MALLFTGHNGRAFEVAPEDLTPSSLGAYTLFDGALSEDSDSKTNQREAMLKPYPLIVVSDESCGPLASPPTKKVVSRRKRSVSDNSGNSSGFQPQKIKLVYNCYGELVDAERLKRPVNSAELTVTETMRLIYKAYHYEFRLKMGYVVANFICAKQPLVGEDGRFAYSGELFLWNFHPKKPEELPPDGPQSLSVYRSPPRVLEIGCGDGSWCLLLKKLHPDWIVEGLDDVDHWSKNTPRKNFRDFMESDGIGYENDDGFGKVHLNQDGVEFMVRSLSTLLFHPNPITSHIYGFIRAKDVFGKLESYKAFLEDVRCILQPEGVVEFIELDPRPRFSPAGRRRSTNDGHISQAQTNWTDQIVDRFKDPYDEQLATSVPEWMKRVEERLKATLRPRDGVPAANLKSWLEGAGFWDVKQLVMRLPVGGDSNAGKLLLEFIQYQTDLENYIPLLATSLPQPNFNDINFGSFYINMHIVSGRKPRDPRPGDMLKDGTRQGMTASTYDVRKRLDDSQNSQWTRATLDANLVTVMTNITTHHEVQEKFNRSSVREKSQRASD